MTIYYTAKDIEEMAAKGIRQIEIGPGITLTDFARETARQLNIALVDGGKSAAPTPAAASPSRSSGSIGKYNKPTGCMHGSNSIPAAGSLASSPANSTTAGASSNTVNRLIDLMGNVIKRGE